MFWSFANISSKVKDLNKTINLSVAPIYLKILGNILHNKNSKMIEPNNSTIKPNIISSTVQI